MHGLADGDRGDHRALAEAQGLQSRTEAQARDRTSDDVVSNECRNEIKYLSTTVLKKIKFFWNKEVTAVGGA